MSSQIAYCGLDCGKCPAFIATQNDDDNARKKTAGYYHKQFGFDVKAEDINCDGCLTEGGRLFDYCMTCEIRKCCGEKDLDNCTQCDEKPCERLNRFHEFSPDAKISFEALLKERG